MKRRLFLTAIVALSCLGAHLAEAKDPKKFLVVTVTKGFRHSSIPTAEKVIGTIAEQSKDFTVDYVRDDKEMAEKMTLENLKKYDGVIFANTTGNVPLPDVNGFLDWLKTGKAFVGMHSATDTFRGHKPLHAFTEMIGGEFQSHPPGLQKVECINEDPEHPACKHFGPTFKVEDEIYVLNGFKRATVHGLLRLNKYPGGDEAGDYPVAWCKKYGEGNVFYTSLGHAEAVWENPEYQKHILGGIRWAAGLEKGDATPQGAGVNPSKKVTD